MAQEGADDGEAAAGYGEVHFYYAAGVKDRVS